MRPGLSSRRHGRVWRRSSSRSSAPEGDALEPPAEHGAEELGRIAPRPAALPVLAIRTIAGPGAGPWFDIVSGAALVGLALAATGQVLLVLGVISLEASFVTGGLGILPVLVWAVAITVLALQTGALPAQLGWGTVVLLAVVVVSAVGSAVLHPAGVLLVSVALLAALVGWLVVVGGTCLTVVASGPVPVSP